jgi:hypothetical protein
LSYNQRRYIVVAQMVLLAFPLSIEVKSNLRWSSTIGIGRPALFLFNSACFMGGDQG